MPGLRPWDAGLVKTTAGFLIVTVMTAVGWVTPARAEEPTTLEKVTVTATKAQGVKGPFLPDVDGAKIYAGKKATSTALAQFPAIQQNNYRQAFAQAPGLLLSEQPNRGNLHINYRGIGDPHEGQDLLVLKDGIPIVFDRLGYSTVYYQPPLEAVERVELIRGGGALLYGPQPGPVLNFVTEDPPADRAVTASTQHTVGSFGTYNTYTRLGGTEGPLGYTAYQHHNHSNGPRANENYDLNGGSAKFVLQRTPEASWTLAVDAYESDHGEPGRLTKQQWETNRRQTLRPGDRLQIRRYASSLAYERELSAATHLDLTLYGQYYNRYSRRRTSNTSTQNNLDRRVANAGGVETRLRHRYEAWGNPQTATVGATAHVTEGPRTQDRSVAGTYPTDLGNPIFEFAYRTVYGALFGEHQFRFGDFSVVPAARLEILGQRVREEFNAGKTSPLHNINEVTVEPVFGVGLQYELPHRSQLYANVSQGYKPAQFDDLAPTGNNTLPATILDPGRSWTYEMGVRGTPTPWLTYDASAFLTDYENVFGTVTVGGNTQRQNVGRARYHGLDVSGEVKMPLAEERLGVLSLYGGASLLKARFVEGPQRDREPAFAPAYFLKGGLIYRWLERAKLALLGTWVEDHYWADNNAAGSTGLTAIPGYTIWDLTGEVALWKDSATLLFGINNLTDEVYFSRVRSDGIEPALERHYYAGMRIAF